MSSWPPPANYPPSRRSRSRSPRSRSSRQTYAEPPYSHDTPSWDTYDRERAWADYERERAAYEYSRRGRSRSPPPPDEGGRKRRRSTSPYDRERYDPRPRYGDDFDAHSRSYSYRSPPRAQYSAPYPPPQRRAPPDPHTFDHPATLKQYAEWFRYFFPQQATEEDNADKAAEQEAGDGSKPRNGIRSRWEKYKKEFAATQLQTMFDHHRKSPWFAEKYDPSPEFVNLRKRIRKQGWRGRMSAFFHDIESGKFDPDLNQPEIEAEADPASKDRTTNGETVAAESGSSEDLKNPAAGGAANGEDEMQFAMDADEEPGDHEASRLEANGKAASGGALDSVADSNALDPTSSVLENPTLDNRRSNRGEEISVPPEGNQVMIRTIPPDIGRVKLEDACGKIPGFMYLALGDPLQKRNYYRAGWLRFHDDADMAIVMSELSEKKIEGFKLHVTHNLRPFINRIRYVPEVASRPERIAKDLANARVLASLLEAEVEELRRWTPLQVEAKDKGEEDVTMENGDGEAGTGEQKGGEDAGREAASGEVDASASLDAESDPDADLKERGSEAVERRVEKVMADIREQALVDVNDDKALEAKRNVVALDLYLAYLRAAFHTCYYCVVVTDHLEELQRKCLKHMRKPLTKAMLEEIKAAEAEKAEKDKKDKKEDEKEKENEKDGEREREKEGEKEKEKEKEKDSAQSNNKSAEGREWKRNDERWLEWFDSKIALLINREGVDPRDYGGKHYDLELTKAAEPYIKREDEGRFRCKNCQKLFKAISFVEKHVANKHPELVKSLDEIPYFNNFALDPHRIQPFTHPPPVVGNSQPPPPQAYGLQGPTPFLPPPDYGRPPSYYAAQRSAYPPPPPAFGNAGFWPDPYGYSFGGPGGGPGGPPGMPPGVGPYPPPAFAPAMRREETTTARRLSDRISGYAPEHHPGAEVALPAGAGLPAKPMASFDPGLGLVGSVGSLGASGARKGGRVTGPPPPPPPDAKEDPRAVAGKRVSYHDMDLVAEGDVELTY